MNAPKPFKAKFEEKIVHNARYSEYHFEMIRPHELDFRSGQYISLLVDSTTGQRRSYSLCSTPAAQHGFELLIDHAPAGVGSQFLSSLQFGDEVQGIGPMGHFVLSEQPEQVLVFVGTGSGIAPLRSMILDLIQVRQDARDITLYWGMRHVEELFWLDDFQDLVEKLPNFHFYPVISRPTNGWSLSTGHVIDLLLAHKLQKNSGFYICGSSAMINDVQKLLFEKGFNKDSIYYEKFS